MLDLGKLSESTLELDEIIDECTAGRAPPLTPADFRVALSKKSFTSKKADEDMVAGLYETTFTLRFAQAKELIYSALNWGDAEAATFANVVASGALAALEYLNLERNAIGDDGMSALAKAIKPTAENASGALDNLQVCWRPTALSPCPETSHMHSPNSYLLFDVTYAETLAQ